MRLHGPLRVLIPAALLASAIFAQAAGCVSHPHTNRSQLLLVSEEQSINMGRQAWEAILNDPKTVIARDPAEVDPVLRVAERIIAAATRSRFAERAKSFDWEVIVIKADDTKNAFALPGGKIAIYTGIFPEAHNENGLAAIMGHEVVHALAQHGAERVSQQTAANVGLGVAAIVLGMDPATRQLATLAITGGILLPFSRSHESEADQLGLLLAAEAGYDPEEAVRVWQRMEKSSSGEPPEFLSTHPSHETRIANLTRWMPNAVAVYQQSTPAPAPPLPRITPP